MVGLGHSKWGMELGKYKPYIYIYITFFFILICNALLLYYLGFRCNSWYLKFYSQRRFKSCSKLAFFFSRLLFILKFSVWLAGRPFPRKTSPRHFIGLGQRGIILGRSNWGGNDKTYPTTLTLLDWSSRDTTFTYV